MNPLSYSIDILCVCLFSLLIIDGSSWCIDEQSQSLHRAKRSDPELTTTTIRPEKRWFWFTTKCPKCTCPTTEKPDLSDLEEVCCREVDFEDQEETGNDDAAAGQQKQRSPPASGQSAPPKSVVSTTKKPDKSTTASGIVK